MGFTLGNETGSQLGEGVYGLPSPSQVLGLIIASSDSNSIEIDWMENAHSDFYNIYRAESKDGNYEKIDTTSTTGYLDSTASRDQSYFYKVSGVNDIDEGDTSIEKGSVPSYSSKTQINSFYSTAGAYSGTAATAKQTFANYDSPILTEGLVSFWPGDDSDGETLIDEYGNNNGDIYGGEWLPSKKNVGIHLNDSSEEVIIPHDNSLDITDEITILAWVYLDEHIKESQENTTQIIGRGDGHKPYGMKIDDEDGPAGHIYIGGNDQYITSDYNPNKLVGYWRMLTLTYDSSTGEWSFFVDDVEQNSGMGDSGSIDISTKNLQFAGGPSDISFSIDEVHLYNKILSADEIQGIYDSYDNGIKYSESATVSTTSSSPFTSTDSQSDKVEATASPLSSSVFSRAHVTASEALVTISSLTSDPFTLTKSTGSKELLTGTPLSPLIGLTVNANKGQFGVGSTNALRRLTEWTYGDRTGRQLLSVVNEKRKYNELNLALRLQAETVEEFIRDFNTSAGKIEEVNDSEGKFTVYDISQSGNKFFMTPPDGRNMLRQEGNYLVEEYKEDMVGRQGESYDIDITLKPEESRQGDGDGVNQDAANEEWSFSFHSGKIATDKVSTSAKTKTEGSVKIEVLTLLLTEEQAKVIEESGSHLPATRIRNVPDGDDIPEDNNPENRNVVNIEPADSSSGVIDSGEYILSDWETEWQNDNYFNVELELMRRD